MFPKYATLIITLVTALLVLSGGVNAYFSVLEVQKHLQALQSEKAASAAERIQQYILDIDRQIGWTELPAFQDAVIPLEKRRAEYLKLLRQAPPITDASWVDDSGRERVRVSRVALDKLDSGLDQTGNEAFLKAAAGEKHFSPPYFLRDSEPYMTIARKVRGGGVTMAEVNLKFIWEVVSQISVGRNGLAYVIDAGGVLIAHPDIALVLQKANLSHLPQVAAMRSGGNSATGRNMSGEEVFSAHASIPSLNWTVFVESPLTESREILRDSILHAMLVLLAGLVVSIVASFLLVRALVTPLRALQDGAAQMGAGRFDQPIEVRTGDELESLAEQFNKMGAELKTSYAQLEHKVQERTAELQLAQKRSSDLLHNMLPHEIAEELSSTGKVRPVRHEEASILFTDFSGFTQTASAMPADRMVAELNEIFAAFDDITDKFGVEKIKTVGDAYMAAAGLPLTCADHAHRCVHAGLEMIRFIDRRNVASAFKWSLRVGIHSGPVVAGVVGRRKYAFDVWGDTVNIASRLEGAGAVGRVNVSAYTCDLIRDSFECEYRGKIDVKGKGQIDMYFVTRPEPVV